MIRGTTPTHVFTLPFDTALIREIKIIYAQNDNVVLEKKLAQCTLKGDTATVKLTQEETLLFNCHEYVQIQVRVLTLSGDALASTIERVSVGKCLENEVLK
jgi:hypothetical protein